MKGLTTTLLLLAALAAAGCAKETPARTVSEFVDDKLLLEAALVRCSQNRNESRYDAECVNAREAVKQIEAKQEAERRAELELQSQRKREALRRTQQAAAEARRRAAEAERLQNELEYQAQFGVLPPADDVVLPDGAMQGNEPVAVVPVATPDTGTAPDPATASDPAVLPPAGSNVPTAETQPVPEESAPADLEAVREELRRRNEGAAD